MVFACVRVCVCGFFVGFLFLVFDVLSEVEKYSGFLMQN